MVLTVLKICTNFEKMYTLSSYSQIFATLHLIFFIIALWYSQKWYFSHTHSFTYMFKISTFPIFFLFLFFLHFLYFTDFLSEFYSHFQYDGR